MLFNDIITIIIIIRELESYNQKNKESKYKLNPCS